MAEQIVSPGTFVFSGVDLYEAYGIRITKITDPLLPELREKSLEIPGISGSYHFEERYYRDRDLDIECDTMRPMKRAELRELADLLSYRGRLYFHEEPDKYYEGRIYTQASFEKLGLAGYEFDVTFRCQPFAFGETITEPVSDLFNYIGTAETPTRLQFTNTGTTTIKRIVITIREKAK